MQSQPQHHALTSPVTQALEQLIAEKTLPDNLYQLIIEAVERPLFQTILKHAQGNQSQAARILGISRSTLRKRLAQLKIASP